MHDYGNFVPEALRSSTDPALGKLGREMELFPTYGDYETIGFPSVLDYTHGLINGESFIAYMRQIFSVADQTYIMKESVRIIFAYTYPSTSKSFSIRM